MGRGLAVLGLIFLLAMRAQAGDLPPLHKQNLPLVINPAAQTGTPTVTATPTETATPMNTPTATATPVRDTPTATLQPPAATYNGCVSENNPGAAQDYPARIELVDDAGEAVEIRNMRHEGTSITGWHLCAIGVGEQALPAGVLGPGTVIRFTNTGAPLWDVGVDAALYDDQGRLMSYRNR